MKNQKMKIIFFAILSVVLVSMISFAMFQENPKQVRNVLEEQTKENSGIIFTIKLDKKKHLIKNSPVKFRVGGTIQNTSREDIALIKPSTPNTIKLIIKSNDKIITRILLPPVPYLFRDELVETIETRQKISFTRIIHEDSFRGKLPIGLYTVQAIYVNPFGRKLSKGLWKERILSNKVSFSVE